MNTIPIEDQFPRHDGMTATDWINHAIALEWHGTTPPNITFADGGPETYIPLFDDTIDQPPPESPRADGKPLVPKPSTTPPMWANNPTKQRRRR